MRSLRFLLLVLLVPLISRADFHSMRPAEIAVQSYANLSEAALRAADFAYPRGRFFMRESLEIRNVRALDTVSDLANSVSRQLHQDVVRLLRAGTPEFRVERHLDRLKGLQLNLNQAIAALGSASNSEIQSLAYQADHAWKDLERSLEEDFGHGNNHQVTATCAGKSGGNFFVPKSHVTCTLFGRGLRGYEVVFQNGGATASAQGVLDPRLNTQPFTSNKVQVGWLPRYTVFAITFNNERVQVAQGTCQN